MSFNALAKIAELQKTFSAYGKGCLIRDGIKRPIFFVLDNYASDEVTGDLIRSEDMKVYTPGGMTLDPSKELDKFAANRTGNDPWRIVTAKPINPTGLAVLWELQVRK